MVLLQGYNQMFAKDGTINVQTLVKKQLSCNEEWLNDFK